MYDFPSLLHTPQHSVCALFHAGSNSWRFDPSLPTSHNADVFVSTSLILNRIRCPSSENRGPNGRPFTEASFRAFVPCVEVIQTSWPFIETRSSPLGDQAASSAASSPIRVVAARSNGTVHSSRLRAPACSGDASRRL